MEVIAHLVRLAVFKVIATTGAAVILMQSAVPPAQSGAVQTDTGTNPLFPCFISYIFTQYMLYLLIDVPTPKLNASRKDVLLFRSTLKSNRNPCFII